MDTQAIYKLADELTEQDVNNAILKWSKEDIDCLNRLIALGDSKQLAYATIVHRPKRSKEDLEFLKFCYEG